MHESNQTIVISEDFSIASLCKRARRDGNEESNFSRREYTPETETPGKRKTNVKRDTIPGDEYQRMLQILIRQRSLKTPGVSVGSEVSDIFEFDDVVYLKDQSCKFFQIKHSKHGMKNMIPLAHLFRKNFKNESEKTPLKNKKTQNQLPNDEQSSSIDENRTRRRIPCKLHLALYFKSFVNIREQSKFRSFDIEDLYIVTNQSLKHANSVKYKNYLTPKNSLDDDNLLFIEGTNSEKYSLNVSLVKPYFHDFFLQEYKEFMKKQNMTPHDNERFHKLVSEFLEKIRLVFNYPDTIIVKNSIMRDIFGDDFVQPEIRKILEPCLIQIEIELLTSEKEFVTAQEWDSKKNRYITLINNIKISGISEYKKNRFLLNVGEVQFAHESLKSMYDDLCRFLDSDVFHIFHIHQSENIDLNVVKVLNFLDYKNYKNVLYFTLDTIILRTPLLDTFLQGNCKLIIVACEQKSIDVMKEDIRRGKIKQADISFFKQSIVKSDKKYIFISKTEDILGNFSEIIDLSKYCKKQYSNGFKDLTDFSRGDILSKIVQFQGQPIPLDLIFQKSKEFAEEVITNEKYLWEIVDPMFPCTISNDEAFSSLGYDKDYYIERQFHRDNEDVCENDEAKSTPSLNESAMTELGETRKIVILVGNSGEGKSTVLTRIANLMKKQYNYMWIIKVNLRSFFSKNTLKNSGDLKDLQLAKNMLFKMAFPNEHNNLEEAIFKKGLEKEMITVTVLLDGFNEVGTRTQSKICTFLDTIKLNKILFQCWITTQVQHKTRLEKKFNIPPYFLKPLTKTDQIYLLVKYWQVEYSKQSPPKTIEVSDLVDDASAALETWKQNISDKNEKAFMSVSLNLKILAAILLQRNRKLDQNLSFLDLYNTFVNYQFLRYSKETSGHCQSCAKDYVLDLAKEKSFAYQVRKVLHQISAKSIISQECPNLFSTDKYVQYNRKFPGTNALQRFQSLVGDDVEGGTEGYKRPLFKIGLLTYKNDNFELSHESYAQFFFSEYVLLYCDNAMVQSFLMDHVLTKPSLQLCRKFIDTLLAKHRQSETLPQHTTSKMSETIDNAELTKKAQASFIKRKQISVILEEKLFNIFLVFFDKLEDDKISKLLKSASLKTNLMSPEVKQTYQTFEENLDQRSMREQLNTYLENSTLSKRALLVLAADYCQRLGI